MEPKIIKQHFEAYKNSDADYLLLCENNVGRIFHNYIPKEDPFGSWETVQEAIDWHLKHGFINIRIYDLYAEFEDALVRLVSHTA